MAPLAHVSVRLGNAKVSADLSNQKVVDFRVTGDAGCGIRPEIEKDGVSGAFAQQFTSVSSKMS
jgi:hypothetical protein